MSFLGASQLGHGDGDGQHADQLAGVKVFLKEIDGDAHHDCHLLNGVHSASWLLRPPSFGLLQICLNRVLLGLRQVKLIDPIGNGAFGQAGGKMVFQPGVAVALDGEKARWFKRWWSWWGISTLKGALDR